MNRILPVLCILAACSSPDPKPTNTGATTPTGTEVPPVPGTPTGTPTGETPATGGTTVGTPGGSTTPLTDLDCMAQTCANAELGATANNGGANLLPEVICALTALRDAGSGTNGQLRVGTFGDVDTGNTLVIDGGNRDVLRQSFDGGSQGIPYTQSDISTCALQPASWFQGCLDSPSMSCLDVDQWVSSCTVTTTATCP